MLHWHPANHTIQKALDEEVDSKMASNGVYNTSERKCHLPKNRSLGLPAKRLANSHK